MDDLTKSFKAIEAKHGEHTRRIRYYDGDHPLAFVNPKIGEVVKSGVVFKKNWCQVIINTTRDRMKIREWNNDAVGDAMAELWDRRISRIANNVHVNALTTGEAFVVAWPDATGKPKGYNHDPRQVHVLYDDDDPDVPRVACKRWATGEREHYLNLYYPDRTEHYFASSQPYTAAAFLPAENPVSANPYGRIPVFHFRIDPRVMVGELSTGIISLQDALNKLLNDMMVAAEYSSFHQRWVIGNFDLDKVKVSPGTVLQIPPSDNGEQPASVGAFPTTPPDNYLKALGHITNDMAALSATPRSYFEGQGAGISGEALQAMEGPLAAKCELYHGVFGHTWADLMSFCMAIQGQTVEAEDIEVIWQPPYTVQPKSLAETREINTRAGIPIKNQLRDEGWTEEDLAQLDQDAPAAQAAPARQPMTPEQAEPRFNGIVQTPDIAGQLAGSGALARALNRRSV